MQNCSLHWQTLMLVSMTMIMIMPFVSMVVLIIMSMSVVVPFMRMAMPSHLLFMNIFLALCSTYFVMVMTTFLSRLMTVAMIVIFLLMFMVMAIVIMLAVFVVMNIFFFFLIYGWFSFDLTTLNNHFYLMLMYLLILTSFFMTMLLILVRHKTLNILTNHLWAHIIRLVIPYRILFTTWLCHQAMRVWTSRVQYKVHYYINRETSTSNNQHYKRWLNKLFIDDSVCSFIQKEESQSPNNEQIGKCPN